jgi:tetratricopeptide (TPR) repeat protein
MCNERIFVRMRSASLTVLFLIALASPSILAQTGEMPLTASKEAIALFMQGMAKAENLEDPGTLFDQAIAKDPGFALGYLFAGQNNRETQKHLATAVSLADKASPGEREWILAARDQAEGNLAGRLAHLQQLLKLHPNDKRAHSQMGFYYRSIGDDATALQHFTAAVKADEKYAPAYNNIGYSNMALGKFDDAEAAFKTYIKLIPSNPNPYDSYAELLMRTGRFDESIKQYNMALAKDPTFRASYRGLGNNYGYKGDHAKSREIYQMMFDKAANDGERNQALASMTNSFIVEGKIDKALEVTERRRAMAEAAGDTQTVFALHNLAGIISLQSGNVEAAAKHFAMATKVSDDPSFNPSLRENRRFNERGFQTRLLAAKGNFDAAKVELEAMRQHLATRKNVNQERGYNLAAGYLELQQKDYAKASEYFAKANPNDPFVWYHQALAFEGAGDKKAAQMMYRRIADWNQLDTPTYAFVRPIAIAKLKK